MKNKFRILTVVLLVMAMLGCGMPMIDNTAMLGGAWYMSMYVTNGDEMSATGDSFDVLFVFNYDGTGIYTLEGVGSGAFIASLLGYDFEMVCNELLCFEGVSNEEVNIITGTWYLDNDYGAFTMVKL